MLPFLIMIAYDVIRMTETYPPYPLPLKLILVADMKKKDREAEVGDLL